MALSEKTHSVSEGRSMVTYRIAVIPGDGVGKEVVAAMMLDFLNTKSAASLVHRAVEQVLADRKVRTPDMGGTATTRRVTDEVIRVIQMLHAHKA
jgi:isocitrate/isopropylmalate dehydrogenase